MGEERGGLFNAGGGPLPLHSVSIKADIKGYVSGLRASLKYHNSDQDRPVEVLFKLPLESKQAVVGFTAIIDGKKIQAKIQEKEEARVNYDDAIASGLTATYGEKKTDDVFLVALGNLPRGQEAQVDLEMVEELSIDAEGRVRFSLPTGLKPRYTPPGSVDPLAPLDTGDSTTPPQHGTIAGFQEFLMQVSNAQQIADVTSPTHKIKTVPANDLNVLNVTLDEGAELVGDLVIEITHKTPHEPMVLVESGKGAESQSNSFLKSPAIMINFYPDISEIEAASELIFLVDRSGSMSGGLIKSAAETLVLFLKSMPEGSYFNIFGFGSRYESLFPSSELYNDETLSKAITHAQSLDADLGGTEILPPLLAIFKQPLIERVTRQIFILTDGAVSNTNECIKEVQKHSHLARCFTFGIGSGASTALVNGIAKAGQGTAEFIKFGERLQPKVIRSLKHALQPPAVTDVSVQFSTPSGVAITSSPKKVPPLFDGDKVVIYGIVERQQDPDYTPIGSYEVKLTGELLGDKISHTLSFDIPLIASAEDGSILPVHRLMGKSMLQDMVTENKPKADIIKLSIEAHVISDETAFIAIHEDITQVVSGAMKTVDIQPSCSSIDQLQQQVNSVTLAIQSNIDSVMTRGDTLDSLLDQSASLNSSATQFKRSARKKKSGGFLSGIRSSISGLFKFGGGSPAPTYTANTTTSSAAGPSPRNQFNPQEIFEPVEYRAPSIRSSIKGDIHVYTSKEIRVRRCFSVYEYGYDSMASSDDKELENELKELDDDGVLEAHLASLTDDTSVPPTSKKTLNAKQSQQSPSPRAATSSSAVIILQQANGSWTLDKTFCVTVGVSMATVESSCPSECIDKRVWSTVIAVVVLKTRFPLEEDEWNLVVKKAESWLQKQVPDKVQLEGLMNKAKTII